ncbi:uncharacterized protein LOC127368644 isoform X3 [Dicentrarchus labrax]|uniref:uncharacterized protein LOC127368644 isoform X3 n=1 Tax=Dicentrarchus labrax TaxID=13489 RepID=UPI0021F58BC5|nr:uncharacterized protein LOC127368644 isoform X3 [Dicentrarchus labrax]
MQPRKCGRSYGPFPCRVWNRSARDITKKTSISDMGNEVTTVSRKRFFVFLVGKTNGAHLELVTKLKGFGQIEVKSSGSDNLLMIQTFFSVFSVGGTFFVFLAGRTNDAHLEFVAKLESIGHIEVNSPKESDYLLVFCPIVSRVGTDISEALDKLPDV